jgi:hypothetical protein
MLELQYSQGLSMNDAHRIVGITVATRSTEPPTAILQVELDNKVLKFEITEEQAHMICTDLERFLTR